MGKEIIVKSDLPEHWEVKGINSFKIFVCNNDFLEWKELPKISPQHMRLAR